MDEQKKTWTQEEILGEYKKQASAKPRKNLIKMVRHINMLNPFPNEESWEYIFFDRLLSDEMVDFILKMKLRTPYYIKDLAKREGMGVEDTAKMADELVHIGILEYTSDDAGIDQVQLPVFAPGGMENTAMDVWRTDEYKEIAPAFLNYILDLQKKVAPMVPMGSALMRAIPVEEAIKKEPKKAKFEEVSYWIEKNAPSIAVAPCECRRLRRMVGEGTNDLEGEWCIELGKYAESCIRVGKARRITKEEAYEILRKAEENGYVHQLSNIDGPDHSVFICNCSWDTCMALKTSWYTGTPNMSRSNYVAEVSREDCVACGGCMEVCPQNAVKLGQKLCQKDPVEIKDAILPSNHKWSKKNWNPDFLTSRENVIPETGTSPCKTNCPAHIAVQGYIKLAAKGKYREALELIKKENPFPAVCGAICNRRCEQDCTRGDVDAPVAIDEIKKFIAEQELNSEQRFIPKKRYEEGKKIAIIGGGPAGLSCAYYLALYGHQVTVFEKQEKVGGMLMFGIPSFRLQKDVVEAEIEVLKELGITFQTGVEVGKDVTIDSLRKEGYEGFYLAIGAQGGRKLGVEGEEAEGVMSGIDFLRSVNHGTRQDLKGKIVVIGGGNVAVDVARSAVRKGADAVEMFCLETREKMPASPEEVEETLEEGIILHNGWGPKRILTENGKVTGVEFKKCLSTIDPETQRFSPKYDESDTMIVECEGVLAAIGQSIEWGTLLEGTGVELNPNQTVKADSFTYATSEQDIFAGGDVYTGPRFAIDAIAAGKQGAESLHRAVWEGHSLVLGRDRRDYRFIDKENLVLEGYDNTPRQNPQIEKEEELTFADRRKTFTKEQVEKETSRCLGCGAAHVDQGICIGCGLCTTRCKFDAIHLIRKYDAWGVPYEKLPMAIVKEEISKGGRILSRKLKGER